MFVMMHAILMMANVCVSIGNVPEPAPLMMWRIEGDVVAVRWRINDRLISINMHVRPILLMILIPMRILRVLLLMKCDIIEVCVRVCVECDVVHV
jgi:hypothetical protein